VTSGGHFSVLDGAHLDRQTMGDAELRREVLALADAQFAELLPLLERATEAERPALAHRLKGAARAVGAMALGNVAAKLEAAPGDSAMLVELGWAVTDFREALRALPGSGG
jgi:HPt (histidine-containing phosphotransfer) domain-containing protein